MNPINLVDGKSYSSCDGGKTWFEMGRGSAPEGTKPGGIQLRVSRIDTETNTIYYEAVDSK